VEKRKNANLTKDWRLEPVDSWIESDYITNARRTNGDTLRAASAQYK